MPQRKVAVFGAGCIGQWVGGHLASAGVDVVLVGRSKLQRTLAAGKLRLTDFERDRDGFELCLELPGEGLSAALDVDSALSSDDFDAVFVCLKVYDNVAAAPLKSLSRNTVVISLQNGVGSKKVLSELLPEHKVVAGMVPYGVVEVTPGSFRRGTSGPLAFESAIPSELAGALQRSGLEVELHSEDDMRAVQWCKLVVNLGNALNALVGQPLATCNRHRGYRLFLAALWEEGLAVMKANEVRLQGGIQGQPLEKVVAFLRLPSAVLLAVQKAKGALSLDPTCHSSMFYDLESRRITEVGELNELVVDMATIASVEAPLNALLVRLVREAEDAREGSPRMNIDKLLVAAEGVAPGSVLSSSRETARWLAVGGCIAVLIAAAAAKL